MASNKEIIGYGKTSCVYLENHFAYKAFPDDYPAAWVAYEVKVQNEVQTKTELFVPICEYLSDTNEIKMKYIDGCTLADRMRKEKYKYGLKDLVNLQLETYRYQDLNLDQAHDSFIREIRLSNLDETVKSKALRALENVEKKQTLCHFDMHFLNVMYDGTRYFIIDWVNAKCGNPILDIARTYVILKQYAQRMSEKYLKLIAVEGSFDIDEIRQAIPAMAALRLLESDSNSFKTKLLEMIDGSKTDKI